MGVVADIKKKDLSFDTFIEMLKQAKAEVVQIQANGNSCIGDYTKEKYERAEMPFEEAKAAMWEAENQKTGRRK